MGLPIDWESSSFVPRRRRRDSARRDRRRAIDRLHFRVLDRSIDHDDDDDDHDDDRIRIIGIEIATRRRRARETNDEDAWTKRRARDGHAQGTEER